MRARAANDAMGKVGDRPVAMAGADKASRFPALIGDIGGTNARFALVDAAGAITNLRRGAVAAFAGLNDAIFRLALKDAPERPRTAVLAVAGPVSGGRATLTNSGWRADMGELADLFGFREVVLVNDWIATALALPSLDAGKMGLIGDTPIGAGTRIAFGPGTGLGVAALTGTRCGWMPLATEGGHVGFGPMNREEHRLWSRLEEACGRIEAETLLSGTGLLRLREALGALRGETGPFPAGPADIVTAARSGTDGLSVEAVRLFAVLLGRFAGDLALAHFADGGVYLAGGIAPHIAPFLKEGGFRREFDDKGRSRPVVERIATALITVPDPAIHGLASLLQDPSAFALEVLS